MHLSYKERLAKFPSLRDFSAWPDVPLDSIDKDKRKGFMRNCRVVKMVLNGGKYKDIHKVTGVPPPRITLILERALAGPEEFDPPLTEALIPRFFIRKPVRKKALSRVDAPAGAKSSFQHLLETVPMLREKLDTVLLEYLKDNKDAENLAPAAFHSYFLLFLDEANHPKDQYPHTEESLGYESARLYMHRRLNELHLELIEINQPKRVISPRNRPFEFGRETQIDEYIYDAQATIYLDIMDEFVPIRIARFSLVVVSDVDTTCSLSYQLALTQHCSQYDVLTAMEKACTYTEPPELLTPGLSYPPGPAFPNNLGDDYARVALNTVALDNALAHCSDAVEDYVCNHHFGTVSLGLASTPKARDVVERAFRLISGHAKRYKSTTGKHPVDPIRESRKNRKNPPSTTLLSMEEAIYVILATQNNTPQAHLMGNTPLELCQHMMSQKPIRLLPCETFANRRQFERRKRVVVKWLKHEGRRPHINFHSCRYQGACLSIPELVYRGVDVAFDYRDIRKLKVYTLTGEYIGEVYAPKSWQRFPHGIKTRQYIERYCRIKHIRLKDPLAEFFWLQVQRKNKQKSALEVTRLYREFTAFSPSFDPSNKSEPEQKPIKKEENAYDTVYPIKAVPPWSPDIAHACAKNEDATG